RRLVRRDGLADSRGAAHGRRQRADPAGRDRADVAAHDRHARRFPARRERRDVRARRVDAARILGRGLLLGALRLAHRLDRERDRVLVHRSEGALRDHDRRETRTVSRDASARRPLRAAILLLALSAVAVPCRSEQTSPFRTRNLSPLVSIFGIPAWEAPSADERLRGGVTTELANHYRRSRRGDEVLTLDGETWRTGLWFRAAVGERWTVSAELPFVRQSGGVLDDVIDAWHSAFGLPDGGRNRRPEGELTFLLAEGGTP